jgi:hypothetical protein
VGHVLSTLRANIGNNYFAAVLPDPEVRTNERVRSTILTSQLPVTSSHEQIGDATVADGILTGFLSGSARSR